jgi:hypothetical protein
VPAMKLIIIRRAEWTVVVIRVPDVMVASVVYVVAYNKRLDSSHLSGN